MVIALLILSSNIILRKQKRYTKHYRQKTKIKTKLLSTCEKYKSIELPFKVSY